MQYYRNFIIFLLLFYKMDIDERTAIETRVHMASGDKQRLKELIELYNIFKMANTGENTVKGERMKKSFLVFFTYVKNLYESRPDEDMVLFNINNFWRAYDYVERKMNFREKISDYDIEDTQIKDIRNNYFDILSKLIDDDLLGYNRWSNKIDCKNYILVYILISIMKGRPYDLYLNLTGPRRRPFMAFSIMKTEADRSPSKQIIAMTNLIITMISFLPDYAPCITETL